MYLRLKVTPDARVNNIRPDGPGRFAIATKAPTKLNLANKHSLQLLAEHLQIPVTNLKIIRGHTMPNKLVLVRPVSGK